MNVMVMGAGALGCFYGGLLARAGNSVSFVARGKTMESLRNGPLVVRSKLAGDFEVNVDVSEHPEELNPPDVVFFAVKAYDLDDAARVIAPVLKDSTIVVAVQNGIDHPERLGDIFSTGHVAPGIVYVSATIEQPGVVVQPGGPVWVHLGQVDPVGIRQLEEIRDLFRGAGVESEVLDDCSISLWTKFMHICAMSGASSLTRLTLREIFDVPETRQLYRDVMAEVTAVARASGVDLSESAADEGLTMLLEMDALPERGSMAYDLAAGKRIEIETLNGAVFHLGEQLGVPVPMNRAIYAALKPYAGGRIRDKR